MPRHSKNRGDGACFGADEIQASKGGRHETRVNSYGIRRFDECVLSLQKCRTPVITPEGVLYDKESLLEYVLTQKRRARRTKGRQQNEATDVVNNLKQNHEGASQNTNFWMPENVSVQRATITNKYMNSQEKVSDKVLCLVTQKPLRMKELIPVHFKERKSEAIDDEIRWHYCCMTCDRTLTNSVKCWAFRKSGNVVCESCVSRLYLKIECNVDPTTGEEIQSTDQNRLKPKMEFIVALRSGGTAFAASGGDSKTPSKYLPASFSNS